jgi:hypothetical protein
MIYTTKIGKQITLSHNQAEYYEKLCHLKNIGEITMTKAYKEATKPLKNNIGMEEQGFKGSIVEFIEMCKQNGWIPEDCNTNNSNATGEQPSVVDQELEQLEKSVETKKSNYNTTKIVAIVAVVAIGLYFISQYNNKQQN